MSVNNFCLPVTDTIGNGHIIGCAKSLEVIENVFKSGKPGYKLHFVAEGPGIYNGYSIPNSYLARLRSNDPLRRLIEGVRGRPLDSDPNFYFKNITGETAVFEVKTNEKGFEIVVKAYSLSNVRKAVELQEKLMNDDNGLVCFGCHDPLNNICALQCPLADKCLAAGNSSVEADERTDSGSTATVEKVAGNEATTAESCAVAPQKPEALPEVDGGSSYAADDSQKTPPAPEAPTMIRRKPQ